MNSDFVQRGVSLVELLIAAAVAAVLLGAIALFVMRGFEIPREQAEQGAIVAEAQVHLERLSDTLRNARAAVGDEWLISAGPCALEVRSNADTDSEAEVVEYTLDDVTATLRRRVNGGPTAIIARSVRNNCGSEPLFRYYSLGGGRALSLQASPPILAEIDRIAIQLVIDVDLAQPPGPVMVETVVTPREGDEL